MGTGPSAAGRRPGTRAASVATFFALLVFGAVQGLVGSFQYAQPPAPAIAIVLAVIIFATCVLCGVGTRSLAGAFAPALGWVVASFVMAMGTRAGSVIITNTAAGQWYLYGGALGAALGAASGLLAWYRNLSRR